MRVTMDILRQNGSYFQAAGANRHANNAKNAENGVGKTANRDRTTISPQGKLMSAIEDLNKQKVSLRERRNELIGTTLENGGDMKTIEVQLNTYDKQLESIDEQIAQLTAQQMQQLALKKEENKKKESDEEKTPEELQIEKFNKLDSASRGLERAQAVASVKSKVEGDIQVDKAEVHLAELDIERLQDKAPSGATVADLIKNTRSQIQEKEADIADLENLVKNMDAIQSEQVGSAIDKTEESAQPAEKVDKSEQEKDEEADTPSEVQPEAAE